MPTARAVTFAASGIADIAAVSVTDVRRGSSRCMLSGRDAEHRARRGSRNQKPPRVPRGRGARLSDARPRAPTCRAARRSASGWRRNLAPTCKASAMCSTSRPSVCIRATTRFAAVRSRKLSDKGNTLVVVEHDEDTIRRADTSSTSGPARASAAARWSRKARRRIWRPLPDSLDGALPGPTRLIHPLQIQEADAAKAQSSGCRDRRLKRRYRQEPANR
jgi:excinuclease ABC subunit A